MGNADVSKDFWCGEEMFCAALPLLVQFDWKILWWALLLLFDLVRLTAGYELKRNQWMWRAEALGPLKLPNSIFVSVILCRRLQVHWSKWTILVPLSHEDETLMMKRQDHILSIWGIFLVDSQPVKTWSGADHSRRRYQTFIISGIWKEMNLGVSRCVSVVCLGSENDPQVSEMKICVYQAGEHSRQLDSCRGSNSISRTYHHRCISMQTMMLWFGKHNTVCGLLLTLQKLILADT